MKNNRLFGIIYLLLSKDIITAKELADYFEVSVRTIYRDIELLSSLNIPVYMNKGKNGGIKLLENYKLDKALLTEKDQKEILFALESLGKLGINTNEVFDKMKTIFNQNSESWLAIDFTSWGKSVLHDDTFNRIKEAILNSRKIEFTYFNSYGQKNKRIVDPMQIYFKHNAWYLHAFDNVKEDYRLFKLNRIKDIRLLKDTFERSLPPIERKLVNNHKIKTILLILEIKKKMSFRVYDEFEESCITILDNGDFRIEVEYPESDWIYGYILSFGENIKVISPTRVQEEIKTRLEKSLSNYL